MDRLHQKFSQNKIVDNDKDNNKMNINTMQANGIKESYSFSSPKKNAASIEQKILQIISTNDVSISSLKSIIWKGVPLQLTFLHAECWKYLLGYYPNDNSKKNELILKKRQAYLDISMIYNSILRDPKASLNESELKVFNQITKDVPRTMQEYPLFAIPIIKEMMTRILYVFSMKHPSSSYVQGFVDLSLPFFLVFLNSYLNTETMESLLFLNEESLFNLGENCVTEIESDIYWCFDSLMGQIEMNYYSERKGIKRLIKKMEKIIKLVDNDLYEYLKKYNILFEQFAVRWVSCLLIRELNIICIIRLFDSYFSWEEGEKCCSFCDFHSYICACLLLNFSEKIKGLKDFHQIVGLLQNLPVKDWNEDKINILIAKAYQLFVTYHSIIINEE